MSTWGRKTQREIPLKYQIIEWHNQLRNIVGKNIKVILYQCTDDNKSVWLTYEDMIDVTEVFTRARISQEVIVNPIIDIRISTYRKLIATKNGVRMEFSSQRWKNERRTDDMDRWGRDFTIWNYSTYLKNLVVDRSSKSSFKHRKSTSSRYTKIATSNQSFQIVIGKSRRVKNYFS